MILFRGFIFFKLGIIVERVMKCWLSFFCCFCFVIMWFCVWFVFFIGGGGCVGILSLELFLFGEKNFVIFCLFCWIYLIEERGFEFWRIFIERVLSLLLFVFKDIVEFFEFIWFFGVFGCRVLLLCKCWIGIV